MTAAKRKKETSDARLARLRVWLKHLALERVGRMAPEADGRYTREEVERAFRSAFEEDALVMAVRASRYTVEDLTRPLRNGTPLAESDARRVAERGGPKARRALVALVDEALRGYMAGLSHISDGASAAVTDTVTDFAKVDMRAIAVETGNAEWVELIDAFAELKKMPDDERQRLVEAARAKASAAGMAK